MVNNSTNIIKTNNHLSSKTIKHIKTMTYGVIIPLVLVLFVFSELK